MPSLLYSKLLKLFSDLDMYTMNLKIFVFDAKTFAIWVFVLMDSYVIKQKMVLFVLIRILHRMHLLFSSCPLV